MVAVGGALGGMARFYVSGVVGRWIGETFPWGTMAVNVSGALAIGATTKASLFTPVLAGPALWPFAVTGFLGCYTTVSSFSLQSLALMQAGEWFAAYANVVMTVAICLGAALVGYQGAALLLAHQF